MQHYNSRPMFRPPMYIPYIGNGEIYLPQVAFAKSHIVVSGM